MLNYDIVILPAEVAQLAVQEFCKFKVGGSIPLFGSMERDRTE
jgi:hypothetical protein